MSSNEWRSNGKCRIHICISNLIDLVLVPLRSNRFRRERDTFTKIWKKKNTNLIIRRSLSLKARRFTLIAYLLPLIPLSINHRLRKIKSFSKLHCNFSKFLSATLLVGKCGIVGNVPLIGSTNFIIAETSSKHILIK